MLTNETTRKLQEMHLGVMAKAFTTQLSDNQVSALSFEDRFALLVDAEWAARKSNHLKRLIKKADFADPGACIEDIEYLPERKLDRTQILRLATCSYIQEAHNIILLGATGAGKTYIACALGIAANRNLYTVRYIRLPDLLVEIAMAGMSWNWLRPGAKRPPQSSVLSTTPLNGTKTSMIQIWLTPFATGSSMMRIPFKLKASP